MTKRRLDIELVRRGLVDSRQAAQRAIAGRNVLVDGAFAFKAASMVDGGQAIRLVGPSPPFVSRAGLKLAEALEAFVIDPAGSVCLDVGSSTGGFTDCLLQAGASAVVAIDVGTNQLHEKIRGDQRVSVFEQTDIRSITPDSEPAKLGPFNLVVVDVSFVSLRVVLPAIDRLANEDSSIVMLIKPQFEAGRQEASRGRGIISDPEIWERVIGEVLEDAIQLGWQPKAILPSSTPGSSGNVEFVTWLSRCGSSILDNDGYRAIVSEAVQLGAERRDN